MLCERSGRLSFSDRHHFLNKIGSMDLKSKAGNHTSIAEEDSTSASTETLPRTKPIAFWSVPRLNPDPLQQRYWNVVALDVLARSLHGQLQHLCCLSLSISLCSDCGKTRVCYAAHLIGLTGQHASCMTSALLDRIQERLTAQQLCH